MHEEKIQGTGQKDIHALRPLAIQHSTHVLVFHQDFHMAAVASPSHPFECLEPPWQLIPPCRPWQFDDIRIRCLNVCVDDFPPRLVNRRRGSLLVVSVLLVRDGSFQYHREEDEELLVLRHWIASIHPFLPQVRQQFFPSGDKERFGDAAIASHPRIRG